MEVKRGCSCAVSARKTKISKHGEAGSDDENRENRNVNGRGERWQSKNAEDFKLWARRRALLPVSLARRRLACPMIINLNYFSSFDIPSSPSRSHLLWCWTSSKRFWANLSFADDSCFVIFTSFSFRFTLECDDFHGWALILEQDFLVPPPDANCVASGCSIKTRC